MGLAVLLVLLGVGCFYLAYREQEPFQEIKVKGGVTETGGTGGG